MTEQLVAERKKPSPWFGETLCKLAELAVTILTGLLIEVHGSLSAMTFAGQLHQESEIILRHVAASWVTGATCDHVRRRSRGLVSAAPVQLGVKIFPKCLGRCRILLFRGRGCQNGFLVHSISWVGIARANLSISTELIHKWLILEQCARPDRHSSGRRLRVFVSCYSSFGGFLRLAKISSLSCSYLRIDAMCL